MKFLNDRVYDSLKWTVRILIPALGALYFGLSSIWGYPYGEQIMGTLSVLNVFLSTLLGISSLNYYANKYEVSVSSFLELEQRVKIYDVLKWASITLLPALGALYFGLSSIWGFPYAEEVIGTINVITLFATTVLGVKADSYLRTSNPCK